MACSGSFVHPARTVPRHPTDERWNVLTHGLGLLLSLGAVPALVLAAARHGETWHVVTCAIYGVTLVALYAASTLYHLAERPRARHTLRVADHACIYLLIAGTYTPFTLIMLRGPWGWSLFAAVWALALVGIAFKVFWTGRYERVSTATYVGMGWIALAAARPMLERFPTGCLLWLLAGGLAYTVGVLFYLRDERPFLHAVWHLFVLAGSACHYVAVMRYVLPSGALVA